MQSKWKRAALLLTGLICGLAIHAADAQTDVEATIKKTIAPKLGANVKVESVKKSGIMGLYEVIVGDEVFYTDEKAQYLVAGTIFDLNNSKNLTQARLDALHTVKFADLPFELAFKQVKGNGKRVVAVFEDPNCGYCKRLRHELQHVDNITIYTFMYDILSDDSEIKSRNIWCSANPAKTWNDWMVDGKEAPVAPESCKFDPHDKIIALGKQLHIVGTPAVFFTDGSRSPGFVSAAALEEKLNNIK
jgi:thiol:disulfide interchange protein DsbC